MKYFVCLIFEILAMIIAYLTNPIVVLFADERGDLPHIFKWWQTYDNCLDIDWMIYEHCVPRFAEYDFNKHYRYHMEQKFDDGTVIAGYVDILNPDFTIKERFQRYVCRVCWLYRNCNYGFSYYVNGVDTDRNKLVVIKKINEPNNEQFICYEKGGNIWNLKWCFYYCKKYCKWFRFRVYLGWKLKSMSNGRHMLAFHISPFKPVE